jgi:hypothetical protein
MEQKGRHLTGKRKLGAFVKVKWEGEVLHGQCIVSVDRQLIGGEDKVLHGQCIVSVD